MGSLCIAPRAGGGLCKCRGAAMRGRPLKRYPAVVPGQLEVFTTSTRRFAPASG